MSAEQNKSILSKKTYWDQIYFEESWNLDNFKVLGDEWYEPYQNEILKWIELNLDSWIENFLPENNRRSLKLLDLGCGNGIFLFRLAELNIGTLHGIDFIPKAVEIANTTKKYLIDETIEKNFHLEITKDLRDFNIAFACDDCLNCQIGISNVDSDDFYDVYDNIKDKSYHILHDKGTLDVFVLRDSVDLYLRNIVKKYMGKNTLYIISTGNLTMEELIDHCENNNLELFAHSPAENLFEFGNSSGVCLTTCAFKLSN